MTSQLPLNEPFEEFILISASTTLSEALISLQESGKPFAVVIDAENRPQTLLQEKHLRELSSQESIPLAEILKQLPSALLVDRNLEVLDTGTLKQLASLLQKTKAPGLMVYQDGQISGIVSRRAIAMALPLDALTSRDTRSDYGDAQVVFRKYICRQCDPPTFCVPRQGEAPICDKNRQHGSMELYDETQ